MFSSLCSWRLAAIVLVCAAPVAHADSDALWRIVHDQCLPDEAAHGLPAPCAAVDLSQGPAKGFAVLKDINGKTQFLLIPTAPIAGIESPALLTPGAVNYFEKAWEARERTANAAPRPLARDAFSLAVNSAWGRTQNQLHIHIDCISALVRKTLKAREGAIGAHWAPLGVTLSGHRYWAMRVVGKQLNPDPFRLLADGMPGARANMGAHTLVVVGARFADGRDGSIILDDRADLLAGDRASGEELQDHKCNE